MFCRATLVLPSCDGPLTWIVRALARHRDNQSKLCRSIRRAYFFKNLRVMPKSFGHVGYVVGRALLILLLMQEAGNLSSQRD